MLEKKNILKSKTIRGVIIGCVGILINQGVIEFMSTEELNELTGLIGQSAGLVFTLYGRISATKKIK